MTEGTTILRGLAGKQLSPGQAAPARVLKLTLTDRTTAVYAFPMEENAEQKKDLTVNQLAAHFDVTTRAVRKWIARGYFPNAYRLSPSPRSPFRVPERDVAAFEAQRRQA